MRVLVTGGAGYIGSHCSRYFNEKGIETVILDNLCKGHREAALGSRLIVGDCGDGQLLDRIFSEEPYDAVIHFAAFTSVGESVAEPRKYFRNNVGNMMTLMDAAVDHGIGYFVFSSSAAVFGEPEEIPIREDHPQRPINPYGETKMIGERMLADYERAYGLHSCSFRYFNAAGDSSDSLIGESHDPETHLIPLVIRAALGKRPPLQVFGGDYDTRDGSCIRDYVHVEDLASAHYLGLRYIMEHNVSEQFNLGSENGFTVLEIIRAFEKVAGIPVPYAMAGRRAGDPAVLVAGNEKAKTLLGWTPEKSRLETILADAYQWELKRTY